jgi:hypothetical protein
MQERMLDDLRSVLQGGDGGNWCVGGSFAVEGGGDLPSSSSVRVPPVIIRFDKPDGSASKVQFPFREASNGRGLKELLRACSLASDFGSSRGDNQDIVGNLDVKFFSTDFHPHSYGIVDTIAQTLLPDVGQGGKDEGKQELRGVRAELSRLSVSGVSPPEYLANVSRYIRRLQVRIMLNPK